MTPQTITYRDPAELKLHPLLKRIPEPDKASDEWASFTENLHAAGPNGIDPIKITSNGLIVSGGRRWRAARQLGWDTIATVEQPDELAATIITETLLGQRDMTRGAKIYLLVDMMPEYLKAAEARRLINLKQNRRTFEKPMSSNLTLAPELTVGVLCIRFGISRETWYQAIKVRDIFAKNPEAKATYEPQLLSGDKNLWNVISGLAGEEGGNKGGERPVNSSNQLELFTTSLDGLFTAIKPWAKIRPSEREGIITAFRATASKMPADARHALAQVLEEINQAEAETV